MLNDTLQNEATIRLVRPGGFSKDTAQTPGSRRLGAIAQDRGIPSSMWGGLFTVPAGGQTPIHHHGKQDTVVYVLGGTALIRWGHRGQFSATNLPDDYWSGSHDDDGSDELNRPRSGRLLAGI